MSDKEERTCPLCAEEMDLTDQQLKPCKCGYEICVWCWHHIMEMAEKDRTEGRCPACRTPYDKEKIVNMAANCKRIVAEINSERKQKSQKAKPKASEGRMHLINVRVIQRNLVYIIGLPLNLADEDLLQQREYFGQYGQVLKVSISRTATGVIQHSSNNSCCVYITYTKEEEAIRCIQSVHSFILEGRPLRACFGTTKYCHAWLRNMPCSIPDCLYLHDFGSQEDSFTKDEIVSAFTRSRVQQIIGATNNMHRRSGNVLPPPADEYIDGNVSLTAKPIANNCSKSIENESKGFCADSDTGKSNALPAAASWVMRVSAGLPPNKNLSASGRSPSDQPKMSNGPQVLELGDCSSTKSMHSVMLMEAEGSCKVGLNSKLNQLESTKEYVNGDCQIALSNANGEVDVPSSTVTSKNHIPCLLPSNGGAVISQEHTKLFSSPAFGEDENDHVIRDLQGLSISLQSDLKKEHCLPVVINSSVLNHISVNLPDSKGSQEDLSEKFSEPTTSPALVGAPTMEDLLEFDDQQLKGLEDICHLPSITSPPCSWQNLNQSSYLSCQQGEVGNRNNFDSPTRMVPSKHDEVALAKTSKNSICNGFDNDQAGSFINLDASVYLSSVFSGVGLGSYLEKCDDNSTTSHHSVVADMGESSIISKILSIDSDAWEDSLTSPQSLVKLLGENDKQHGSIKIPSLLKESDCRQSRFSFARQDDFSNYISDLDDSTSNIGHSANRCYASNDLMKNKDVCVDEYRNIFSSSSSMESDNFPSSYSFMSSAAFSKAPTSAPPGFAVPSRAPPPGFSTHGTMHKSFDISASPSHLLQTSAPLVRNGSRYGDAPFVNPAILEVDNGIHSTGLNNQGSNMRQTSSPQLNPFDHDARLQLLMRQSISGYQNPRFPDHALNRFSPPNDAYGISMMLNDQSVSNNSSPFLQSTAQRYRNAHISNGHFGSRNEVKSISDLGMSDYITNGRHGFNKFIPKFEDLKCHMSDTSNLYNRGFAM